MVINFWIVSWKRTHRFQPLHFHINLYVHALHAFRTIYFHFNSEWLVSFWVWNVWKKWLFFSFTLLSKVALTFIVSFSYLVNLTFLFFLPLRSISKLNCDYTSADLAWIQSEIVDVVFFQLRYYWTKWRTVNQISNRTSLIYQQKHEQSLTLSHASCMNEMNVHSNNWMEYKLNDEYCALIEFAGQVHPI